ncbi:MAG: ATP-dependent DNA helicase [Candidatus Saccharibacteria bacterium]|nr:ATP-dependent DNA helicase [Candidatus Saccharibacteria bacterium]
MSVSLNKAQQEAVDHIYGPLLVLAGPGTGKTQLLSARITNILQKTDANPQNILCLTFTENAAQNMRERLTSMIGDGAYDVHINTYHGFGSDIIRAYPQYFENINLETGEDSRIERPIDDLKRIQIVEEIINKLPYSSPLIGARHYIKNVSGTISELKRALVTPDSLRALANNNLKQVQELSPKIAEHLSGVTRFPSKADQAIELFSGIVEILENHDGLAEIACEELHTAMAEAADLGKSTPLTAWKNKWLTRDSDNQFRLTDQDQHLRMVELAGVFEKYNRALVDNQLYDFDDMILRVIDALKNKDELRFNLQEKYQFILLDEFQDTNAAQFELVKQLANNPVNEGRPDIFAVGDDDQAIYAFQGARVSNMLGFINAFADVVVINLTENYRSHPDIIHTAHNIARQIESRLHLEIEGIEKTLTASANNLPKNSDIERHEFDGEANEYSWVANRITELVSNGTHPKEIAVLAPKHKYLEGIIPFLSQNNIPVSYEKREDILQTPMLQAFRLMSRLILACNAQDKYQMSELFPQVLSLEFFDIPVKEIWAINWLHRSSDSDGKSWAELALDNPVLEPHILFFLKLGLLSDQEPLEYMLDYLTGNNALKIDSETSYTSLLKSYYFADSSKNTLNYFELLTNLSTIREHLRSHQSASENLLKLQDFIDFIQAYETAEQPLINTHPIAQSADSVQIMTTYKAKGLEFEHVFLLSVHDDVWGKKARSNSNKLTLPANLQHVRYQGSDEDELRRLLFVAITRAKHGLYLTSHASRDNGKATEPVKYLLEFSDGDTRKTTVLPEAKQAVIETHFDQQDTMQAVETLWNSRHLNLTADLKSLLQPRLDKYVMSPTHLNTFIDTEHGGAEVFLLQTLLRFPQAPGEDGEFGSAIHATLEKYQMKNVKSIEQALKIFDEQLKKRYIARNRMDDYHNRGHNALKSYLSATESMWLKPAKSEVDFRNEGVILKEARLTGKIDRLEIDEQNKTVDIVDFKTGKPLTKWDTSIKALKYKQQLYFYKLLIEGSHTYKGYKVNSARLEFVEPDTAGKPVSPLYVDFNTDYEKEIKDLIAETWTKIQTLDF